MAFSAVVLAGGVAARLDGADKASVELHGRTLLTWALDAVIDAAEVVVVGDPVPTDRPVTFTREDPRHGGPVAALLTGRDALLDPRRWLAVLACDMPYLTAARPSGGSATPPPAATAPSWSARTAAVSSRWCSTWPALDAVRPDHEAQHGLALHRLLAPSTWPRSRPRATSTATSTPGPTSATSRHDRTRFSGDVTCGTRVGA